MSDQLAYYQEIPQMALFEGVCPNHPDKKVAVTHVGGVWDFIVEHLPYVLELPPGTHNIWKQRLPDDPTDGEIEFKCPEGCTFTVAHNIFGDWNL